MEIQIKDVILHILDSNSKYPVFSQDKLNLDDERIYNFISKHMGRIFIDQDVKMGKVESDSEIANLIKKVEDDFIKGSISISEKLYKIMKKYPEIPSGDFLVGKVDFEENKYLILIKFNYREGYTHYVDYGEEGTLNKIIVNKVMLPSELQRNMEIAAINLDDLSLRIIEKEYTIEEEKCLYFSQSFLESKTDLSTKESIRVIRNLAKEITKEYYADDFDKVSSIKEAIYEDLDRGEIEIENVASKIFRESSEIKNEYLDRVEEAGVKKKVDVEGIKPEKRLTVHKLKMDNGISLDIPVELYRNKDIVEFMNNPDGTISIIIKNIDKMKQGL